MANHPTHASPIIKPLEPVPLFARRRWLLVQDWRYRLPDDTICLIPRGIIIDGASVPRFLNALVSPTGSLFVPSLIHDYGYRFDSLLIDEHGVIETRHEGAGRKHWDDLLYAITEQRSQRPTWFHATVWAALRLFGAGHGRGAASQSQARSISMRIGQKRQAPTRHTTNAATHEIRR